MSGVPLVDRGRTMINIKSSNRVPRYFIIIIIIIIIVVSIIIIKRYSIYTIIPIIVQKCNHIV